MTLGIVNQWFIWNITLKSIFMLFEVFKFSILLLHPLFQNNIFFDFF